MNRLSPRTWIILAAVIAVIVIGFLAVMFLAGPDEADVRATGPAVVLGQRTKTSGCRVDGALPDRACSPGATFPNATKEQICKPGYAKSVRDVPESLKIQVYNEYGIRSHKPGEYEIDHIVSLELGGSNDIANLYPEAAEPRPGFHEKDRFENYLHDQVCSGKIAVAEAQRQISDDWLKYWEAAGKP